MNVASEALFDGTMIFPLQKIEQVVEIRQCRARSGALLLVCHLVQSIRCIDRLSAFSVLFKARQYFGFAGRNGFPASASLERGAITRPEKFVVSGIGFEAIILSIRYAGSPSAPGSRHGGV
jgi:hypothetical protein